MTSPLYRDTGVVLRTYKLGEADRIVVLLTEQHGKVRAVAKGVRKTMSKFGARLEPLSHVLADLVECAATAWASLVVDIDNLLDPLEMGRQRAPVGLAQTLGRCPACIIPGMFCLGQGRLDFFQGQLKLIGIDLLRPAPETMTLQGVDDRLQAFNLSARIVVTLVAGNINQGIRTRQIGFGSFFILILYAMAIAWNGPVDYWADMHAISGRASHLWLPELYMD